MPFYLWLLLGVLLALLLFGFLAGAMMFRFALVRPKPKTKEDPPPDGDWGEVAKQVAKATERILAEPHEQWIIRSFDGLTLRALYLPNQNPTGKVLLAIHGYHCTGMKEFSRFVAFYQKQGFSILLPDNRAHGESEGKYIGFGWLDRRDTVFWARELIRRLGSGISILLHGVSMGSATVLCAAGESDLPAQVAGVVADCGYTSAIDEFKVQIKAQFSLPSFPLLGFASLICRIRAGWFFRDCSPLKQIQKTRLPVLLVHGASDSYVPTRFVHSLYAACKTDKELLLVPEAGHALSYYYDPAAYEAAVCRLIQKAISEKTDTAQGGVQ